MHSLIQDVRYGIRLMTKNPGFFGVAIVVLALGIGANTAVFSLVNAMMFQPIPSEGADIVGIYNRDKTQARQLPGVLLRGFPGRARRPRNLHRRARLLDDAGGGERG